MKLEVGSEASLTRVFTEQDIQRFAHLTGDMNPLHVDPAASAAGRFGRPVAHGLLTASLFSRLLGTVLPGPGTVYLRQYLSFRRPVYPGEPITARVRVEQWSDTRRVATLRTTAWREDGQRVIDGKARVLVDEMEPS